MRRERFASVKRRDITPVLPWLKAYTCRAPARGSDPAHEVTDEAKFKRASLAYRHPGGVTMAARSRLAEPRAPGREETWERVKAKFPDEGPISASEAAAAAVAASASDFGGKGAAPGGTRRKS